MLNQAVPCARCLRLIRRCLSRSSSGSASLPTAPTSYRLVEIGRLEDPQISGYYQAGQFFLHRVFGYRGVILFPWMARLYDRDVMHAISDNEQGSGGGDNQGEGVVYDNIRDLVPETKPYYQALIDNRDFPYMRSHPEGITFLASGSDSALYTLPGLDYVSHDDVLPYTSTALEPFHHKLFPEFFVPTGDKQGPMYIPRDVLHPWRERNHSWLELSQVHRETTHGVRVTVMPFFMGHREQQQGQGGGGGGGGGGGRVFFWRYNVRIESLEEVRVQLKERQWRVYSEAGTLETVNGKGVIGQQPIFTPTHPAFQYSSHVSLQYPTGHMWGTFRMERCSDRSSFEVRIPPFSLENYTDTS